MNNTTHCGFIAIIGRPNVGKSTLVNTLLGQKISITSNKPQTTRHQILGIRTEKDLQAIFVDTPGLHSGAKHALNRLMIQSALTAIHDVDVIFFMIDARKWTEEDADILDKLKEVKIPIILLINKVDRIKNKDDLLPIIQAATEKFANHGIKLTEIIPLSALKGTNVEAIDKILKKLLPEGPFLFPDDQITDKSERFIAAELIREKLMRLLGQEVPHALTVEIEEFKVKEEILHVSAIIWVERKGQKIIVIGKKGERLKEVGRLSRLEMERMFEQRIFLRLWVKVKSGWKDDERALQSLGYAK